MIALAQFWEEPRPQPPDGADPDAHRARTGLRPVPAPPLSRCREEGVQLPLLSPDELESAGSSGDRVPELTHYRDEGCRYWHACLSCPYPRCLFEEPGGARHALNAYRDGEIQRMYSAGVPVLEIADHFGIARRSVYRVLGGVRRHGGSRESGVGSRERLPQPKRRSHVPRRERARLPTPDSRLPRD